ncbi:MAG: hypothetical protein DRQ39_04330 [Gammaproteobacteria bacterium]|nr:MAG: hypothetical protein DRQ39_04330 [Gammaproteobacteria bacterium]
MANISNSNNISWFWVFVIVAFAVGIGLVVTSSFQVVGTGEMRPAKIIPQQSDAERLGLTIVCLNGVQYWKDNDRDTRTESLAPKYSPGYKYADICEGHGEKKS